MSLSRLEKVAPEIFYFYIIRAYQQLKRPLNMNLTIHKEEDFLPMDTYLTEDRQSGFAISPDGSLNNLFSFPHGRGDYLVANAVALGATKLDCYDGYLPSLYSRHGFAETGRDAWDDQYAPDGWDVEKFGRPDVVYMALPK